MLKVPQEDFIGAWVAIHHARTILSRDTTTEPQIFGLNGIKFAPIVNEYGTPRVN